MNIVPKSDAEIVEYARKQNFHFDQVYRAANNDVMQNLSKYGISGLQFVNLYDSNGVLLRKSTGERCEIDIMSYLKDSLNQGSFVKNMCDTCNFNFFYKYRARLIDGPQEIPNPSSYKIVIGWAAFWDKKKFISKRTELVNNMIPELKRKNVNVMVIGLSLDPYMMEIQEK